MKKIISLVTVLCTLCLVLGACSANTFQDGVYRAEMADYDTYGYKEYIVVTVSGGTVVDLEFDAQNAEGQKRSDDTEYYSQMEEAMGQVPTQYVSALVNQYLLEQSIKEVDAVAGATLSSNNFKAMLKELENNIKKGKTELVVVKAK